jgi:hypothetical protein
LEALEIAEKSSNFKGFSFVWAAREQGEKRRKKV